MDRKRSQQFMQKLVGDVATSLAVALLLVGERSGLLGAMAGAGWLSAGELAERSGVPVRYVEEWLAALASTGYVEHDPAAGRFTLPDEHAMFLVDPTSEYYLGGLVEGQIGMTAMAPRVAEAFSRGEGVPFTEFGPGFPGVLERMNRSVYERRLVRTWLPELPDVVARLREGGRAVDVGCGTGVVPITLAAAFPAAHVVGLDLDERSVATAAENAAAAGVDIEFVRSSVAELALDPPWDLVTSFDVVHDLPDPVGALRRIRAALAHGGTYLMVEPRVAGTLEDDVDNPFARMLYGISTLHCVPQSLAQGGPGLGACWGESRARELAAEAGFGRCDRLDIRSPVMAFYALGR
ncbi:methyltransferase domain-containing protein [Pseudonocardia sp.]|uniref:methyltransferase domain-containing protein n=1 Tax=Pseudonocardia sp. TaxID=60912 RepID=UPI003D12911B